MLTQQDHADALLASIGGNARELSKVIEHIDAKWLGDIIAYLEDLNRKHIAEKNIKNLLTQ